MAQVMNTLRAGWGWFRAWRRTRPFWGGLLLLAAGVELLVAPAAQSLILPIDLIIYAGIAGVSGTLIGVLLIAIGVLSWLQPAQHTFFGVVGLMLALVSFVTSNFGGFVIGMLLGIVGGALVFAWGPDARRNPRGRRRAGAGEALARTTETEGPDEGEETAVTEGGPSLTTSEDEADTTVDDPRTDARPLAAIALPLAVAVTIASAPAPALGWPWDWLFPGDEEEQSEETPEEEPSPSPSEDPEDPEQGSDPEDDAPEDDTPEGETDEEEREEDEEDLDAEDADAEDCELRIGDSAVIDDEQEFLRAVLACEAAEEEGAYPEVMIDSEYDCFRGSVRDSGLTADSLTMFGARYEGVVECPTADGPRRYLRLTMSRSDMDGGELWFDDAGVRMSLGLPTMRMDGNVELHVTSMSVRLLGIPLTFTPDFPPPLLLPIMYVTDVDVGDPMASTDKMTIPGLDSQHAGGGS
ncbi:DUF6114 domain-containing protein [Nocardiopsis alkaliphila]|uniref:DUF6114 domain-containing protein n=1 Tax=Nocardiopsis alkaliphila TaxID=225762 RepID=UPI00034569CF|nr:DUF6114 domain-containing protein [Nocardiopsis alkaliphila]